MFVYKIKVAKNQKNMTNRSAQEMLRRDFLDKIRPKKMTHTIELGHNKEYLIMLSKHNQKSLYYALVCIFTRIFNTIIH
jgi:hypothetical protein